MLAYFDTSSFVPLLIDESASTEARQLWHSVDAVAATRLLHVETVASLQRAFTAGRIDQKRFDGAVTWIDQVWGSIQLIELDESLMRLASAMAVKFGLRGYDATHCAAAYVLSGDDTVAVSGDQALLDAWRELGLATAHV